MLFNLFREIFGIDKQKLNDLEFLKNEQRKALDDKDYEKAFKLDRIIRLLAGV